MEELKNPWTFCLPPLTEGACVGFGFGGPGSLAALAVGWPYVQKLQPSLLLFDVQLPGRDDGILPPELWEEIGKQEVCRIDACECNVE